MFLKEQIEFNRKLAKHIGHRRFFGWFLGLAIPITLCLSLFGHWTENDNVRLAVVVVGYGLVIGIMYWKVWRPAVRKLEQEILDTAQNDRH